MEDSEKKKIKFVTKPFHIMGFISMGAMAIAIMLFAILAAVNKFSSLFYIPVTFLVIAEILGIIYLANFWRCMQYNQVNTFGNHSPMSYIILGRKSRVIAVYCGIIFPLMGFLHCVIIRDANG